MGKRPGFKIQPTIFRLRFEDEQYEGLEIEAKSMPLREFFELQELQGKSEGDTGAAREVIARLAGAITGWNLEDEDGHPIKPDAEGLSGLEIGFVTAILGAWTQAIANVPNRSRGGSNGGETSLELSIPMDQS